jgi:hypothetical protein
MPRRLCTVKVPFSARAFSSIGFPREFKPGERLMWDFEQTLDPVEFEYDHVSFLADRKNFLACIAVGS